MTMNRMKPARWAAALACALSIATAPQLASAGDHRGGVMRLVAVSAAGTVDPHINYTLQYWQIYQPLYDGLLAFKKVAGPESFIVVPDLAEALPKPQDGGLTYVFKLRKGIKFSDGRDLGVKDVVASFQRIFKVSGPTAGTFYSVIVGSDACLKTPASCTLAGGISGDEAGGTVTFHLTRPDAEFFDKLAVPHASILPADAPAKDVGVTPLPTTGPYMIASYDPNKQMKLVRNPYFKEWSREAQPDGYPDEIDYNFGLTDEAEVTEVQNGQADWMFDQPPSDRLGELGTKYAKFVHITPLTAMWYVPMNNNLPPFDNIKARQAVNYAIDRKAVSNLFGGANLAAPICQMLPPNFPGHVDYCPYTRNPGAKWSAPNMAKARELMKESGTAGQKVTIIAEDTSISRSIATYLQSLLKQLGYDVSVKPLSPDIQFTYIQNTKNKVQMSISQWYQDYPAGSDFLYTLASCDSFHPNSDASVNISGFCDHAIDADMKRALALGVTDGKAANELWAKIDRDVTDKSPVAVLFTPKHLDFVSKRLGNFQFSYQYYFLPAQAWVQ
jgi:peptide/nickel transport system substrate-binding protein